MKQCVLQKLENNRGVNRLVAILLIAVLALLALTAAPAVLAYKARADEYACALARDKAARELAVDYGADRTSAAVLDGLCPAGGEVRAVWTDGVPDVACSLHGG